MAMFRLTMIELWFRNNHSKRTCNDESRRGEDSDVGPENATLPECNAPPSRSGGWGAEGTFSTLRPTLNPDSQRRAFALPVRCVAVMFLVSTMSES